jgi:hypothetical protein
MGKTFVGLMLIERMCRYEKKRVALFAPKSARESVWEVEVAKHLPSLGTAYGKPLLLFSHSDFFRTGGDIPGILAQVRTEADVVIVDESHYFRNKGVSAFRSSGTSCRPTERLCGWPSSRRVPRLAAWR